MMFDGLMVTIEYLKIYILDLILGMIPQHMRRILYVLHLYEVATDKKINAGNVMDHINELRSLNYELGLSPSTDARSLVFPAIIASIFRCSQTDDCLTCSKPELRELLDGIPANRKYGRLDDRIRDTIKVREYTQAHLLVSK